MIEVKNIVKSFNGHVAVDDISFHVEKGQIVGFLGPNGAGKSTTMNMITGYMSATEGEVIVNGHNIYDEPELAKKSIGYLPELPPLYPDMRVREYLSFVSELKKVEKAKRKDMIADIMSITKINDVSERLIKHLSKGYKQRVGLAGAIMGYPEILILDEPTVGLDPKQIIEIRDLIKKLSKNHTILLSSHILQEVSAVCDTIMIINQGKLIVSDRPENIAKHMDGSNELGLMIKGNREVIKNTLSQLKNVKSIKIEDALSKDSVLVTLTAEDDSDIRETVFYALAKANCPILEMKMNTMSLEEIFLKLTISGTNQHGGKKTKKIKIKKETQTEELKEEE